MFADVSIATKRGGCMPYKGQSPEKSSCSFGFCPNEGGEGPAQIFGTFSEVHYWSIKGVHFLQNANNLNFKLFS